MELSKLLAKQTHDEIYCDGFRFKARKKVTDFTRNRKMTFEELIIFMLQSRKCSTSTALRRFFASMSKTTVTMSQQSLSEARKKINVCAFEDLFKLTVKTMTKHCVKKWCGYRIYANDGTKIALPSDEELRDFFGAMGKDKTAPTAQGSLLYDVLNDIAADAYIKPLYADERTLAKAHIEAVKTIAPDDKNLLIYDRGYASFELISKHETEGLYYLMRVKSKFNLSIDAQTESDGYVWLEQDGKRIHVRVIKFQLDNGKTETLITNITDKRLGKKAFKKLYFLRWPVECKYDVVKNKLQLENFNTRTVEGIQQDFYAAMYLTNFAAACAADAHESIKSSRKNNENKYEYKANMNELIGILKDRFVFALTVEDDDEQAHIIDSVLGEIKRYVIPIRDNRQAPRNAFPRKAKFHHNQKANC